MSKSDDLISRQAAVRWVKTECNPYGKPTLDFESGKKVIEHLEQMPSADRPRGYCMPFEDVAQMMSNLFGECACDVNGNDEWLPQVCKYADTECPHPKEKKGCWMQFLMQGGADMKGGNDAAD